MDAPQNGEMEESSKTLLGKISEIASKIIHITKISSENMETLEERIIEVSERERMVVKRETLKDWSLLVYDLNRIHFFPNRAEKMGFKDSPVHGTLIAAHSEQYVLDLLQEINKISGQNLNYVRHSVDFKRPLYSEEKADWQLIDVEEQANGINLYIVALDSRKKPIIVCRNINLAHSKIEPDLEKIKSSFSEDKVIIRKKTLVEEDELEFFYKCLEKKPREEVPFMYVASFIPSALLDLLSRKMGKAEGGYSGIELEFYNQPKLGIFETKIIMPSAPISKRKMNYYTFEALCLQDSALIFKGQAKCYSPNELV